MALPLVGYGLAYTLQQELRLEATNPETVSLPLMTEAPQVAAPPAPEPPPVKKVDIEYVVRPNDTLGQIFQRLTLDAAELPALLGVPAVRDSFALLKPGERLTFALWNDVCISRLTEARRKVAAAGIAPLSMEEIQAEIEADRAERRNR